MKRIIKRFWGVAFVVVLLSTLFVGAVPQVSAGNFALGDTFGTPGNAFDTSTKMAPAAGFGINDVAQSGATVYAVGNDAGAIDYLYKSTDGGLTYVQTARGAASFNRGLPYDTTVPGVTWGLVAVAPDDPNIVVVVNTENVTSDTVWLSTSGGAVFTNLPGAAAANITCVAVSSALGPFRYITIGGQTGPSIPAGGGGMLQQWTMGATAPAWATVTQFANLATDKVAAVTYSPNFGADQSMLVVTETVGSNGTLAPSANGFIGLHVYRYDLADWDQNVDASFPRYLARTWDNGLTLTRASFALDPNFYMGDEAAQIGFIGATVTANVAGTQTVLGGVYRLTYAPATVLTSNNTLTLVDPGVGYNSVAWDGTNLMGAVIGVPAAGSGLLVRRSATATSPFPSFLPSTTVKTPGTGNATLVMFNASSGVGLAFSRGANSAVCRTTDYGKSFNGIALVNSLLANGAMGAFKDMWISPDGATRYYTVGDGVDMNVWRQTGFTWERVCILPGATAQNWTVAADIDDPDNVVIARVGATTLYKSTDGGETNWTIRTSSFALNDIAVQDANTIYVAVAAFPWVLKGTGPFTTWTTLVVPFAAAGGNAYNLNLIADNQLIVGGTTGGVAYTADGGTTWGACANMGAGNTITAASGVAAGDYIYAVSVAGGSISRWIIGTSFAWTAGNAIQAGGPGNGIALSNGVLYVLNPVVGVTLGHMHRILQPTVDFTGNATVGGTGTQSNVIAALYIYGDNIAFATTAGTTSNIFAIDIAGFDPIDSYSDYITSVSNAPALVYPLAGDSISINSISGIVAGFVFKWTSPPVVVPPIPAPQTWNYNLAVYLDEAGLVPIAGWIALPVFVAATPAADLSVTSAAAGFAAVAVPGETYYWRVRVNMGTPVEGYWSDMKSFMVEQLVAVVPVISSPVNGTTIDSTTPAFSWSPIAGATSYSFELASDVDFTNIIYSATPASAGAAVTTALEPGTYFWRVKALTPAEGEWSTVANFIIAEPPAPPPVILPTQPPTLGSPVNGASVNTVTPGFSWAPISGATMYRFQLAKDAEFATLVYTIDTASTGAGVPAANKLIRGEQYYWRVMALAPAEGEWSTVANFNVANLPAEQAPPVVVTTAPAPTIIVTQTNPPATTTTVVVPPAEEKVVNPTYIWAIIIIGAVLVIAVIVLIVRTRRSV